MPRKKTKYPNCSAARLFEEKWPKVQKNILSDRGLDSKSLRKFFDLLESINGAEPKLKNLCLKFFRKHQRLGSQVVIQNIIGRMTMKVSLCEALADELLKRRGKIITPTQLRRTIDDCLRSSNKYALLTALKRAYAGCRFGRHLMWSFENDQVSGSFYSEINLSILSCQLGLSDQKHPKYAIAHKLPHSIKAYRPTAFDAEFCDQWQPGGKTKPLPLCTKAGGYKEIVHKPNFFDNIGEIYDARH